jgi:ribosomal protein L37AE/L43A
MGRYKNKNLNEFSSYLDENLNENPNKRHGKCEQCGKKTILRRISIYNERWLCETCRKSHTIDETDILHQIGLNKKSFNL